MNCLKISRGVAAIGACIALTLAGCTFRGVNSLPLPGTVGRGPGASTYRIEIADVDTLQPNSPVMVNDVVIGTVRTMTVKDWHAVVEVSVRPDAVVPANAVASIGQTSLLGSMHLSLDPPLGQPATGRLLPGSTLRLDTSTTYPSTEQTLSAVSIIVNAGGLGQLGDVVHNLGSALSGHEDEIRTLLTRLNDFVGTLDKQRDHVVATIQALNRLATTFATQRDTISEALDKIPPALDVLVRERPRIVTALDRLRVFSSTTTGLITDTQADLVKNLDNLGPTLKALADVGPDLDTILAYLPTFPFTQNFLDRALRGDYFNIYANADLTIPRLKRSLFLGTRWGDPNAQLVPAPGEPTHLNFTYQPHDGGPNVPAPSPIFATPFAAARAQPPPNQVPAPTAFPPMDEADR